MIGSRFNFICLLLSATVHYRPGTVVRVETTIWICSLTTFSTARRYTNRNPVSFQYSPREGKSLTWKNVNMSLVSIIKSEWMTNLIESNLIESNRINQSINQSISQWSFLGWCIGGNITVHMLHVATSGGTSARTVVQLWNCTWSFVQYFICLHY